MAIRFRWDQNKSHLNKAKRGVSFDEAQAVFSREVAGGIRNEDPEQHYSIGFASNGVFVTVIYEFRRDDAGLYIWIVTLWKTTKEEKRRIPK